MNTYYGFLTLSSNRLCRARPKAKSSPALSYNRDIDRHVLSLTCNLLLDSDNTFERDDRGSAPSLSSSPRLRANTRNPHGTAPLLLLPPTGSHRWRILKKISSRWFTTSRLRPRRLNSFGHLNGMLRSSPSASSRPDLAFHKVLCSRCWIRPPTRSRGQMLVFQR